MMLAAGVGAFGASIFHLMTHAFFKALLFLGAGSVIHAIGGEQDIRKMGGLRRHLPITHATFAIAVWAIAGVPPFAGFFSKDEILWSTLGGPIASAAPAGAAGAGGGFPILWAIGVLTAGLTAFYMTRLYLLVFAGTSRLPEETRHHLHESPPAMTVPLILLAIGSVGAGFLGLPEFLTHGRLPNLLEVYFHGLFFRPAGEPLAPPLSEGTAMGVALLVSFAGIVLAWLRYGRTPAAALWPEAQLSEVIRFIRAKLYVDEAIEALVLRPYGALCRFSAAFDEKVIDGAVNSVGAMTDVTSQLVRLLQTGSVRNYALFFFLGAVAILFWAVLS
jgi:NADH-quinone oxidoreductase subunit L